MRIRIFALIALLMIGTASAEMPVAADTARENIAHIRVVGDVMAHDHQLQVALREDGSYDFSESFHEVAPLLQNADYTVANLETVMDPDAPFAGYPAFNTPTSMLDALKNAGVDFLTMANNHMLDGGFEGLVSTVDAVEAAGFDHAGAYRTPEEAQNTAVVEINGIHIGFLCYTENANGNERTNRRAREYGLKLMSRANYAADVRALRDAGADFIVCLPHWGKEYQREPEKSTRKKAEELIRAGVDIIIGSHPHMVQPIETLTVELEDGTEKSAVVVWSLGNFLSNMYRQYTYSGIIFDFIVEKRADGTCAVRRTACLPVYVWNRADKIQLLCSSACLKRKPDGMTAEEYADLRVTYDEITELLNDGIAVLEV